jgi:hypothetical protein
MKISKAAHISAEDGASAYIMTDMGNMKDEQL